MNKLLAVVCGLYACLALAEDARAQGMTVWFDAGPQRNLFGADNGLNSMGLGAGLQFITAGDSSQSRGMAIGLAFEGRKAKAVDVLTTLEVAFRAGPVSFGPGINVGLIGRPNVLDSSCLGAIPQGSSCQTSSELRGYRDIGNLVTVGLSGFAKGTFGPQRRAFVQGRLVYYGESGVSGGFLGTSSSSTPTDFPDLQQGADLRISGGYVFGDAQHIAKILRAQLMRRVVEFSRTGANMNGMFDQETTQFSVGLGFVF